VGLCPSTAHAVQVRPAYQSHTHVVEVPRPSVTLMVGVTPARAVNETEDRVANVQETSRRTIAGVAQSIGLSHWVHQPVHIHTLQSEVMRY